MKVRIFVFALIVGLFTVSWAFSSGSSESKSTAGGPVNLTIWYFNWPPGWQYQEQRIQRFMQEHPNIKVTFDHSVPPVGTGGFEDKITTSLATGTAPDVFAVINPQAKRYIDQGLLAPIDDQAAKALGYDSVAAMKAAHFPGAYQSWSNSSGVPYGFHWELSWLQLYSNDAQLKAAGIDPNTVSLKTWQDVIDLGKRVIKANPSFYLDANGKFKKNFLKLPMYYDDTWSMQVLTAFLAQSGGRVLNSDLTKSTINNSQGVKALTWMMKLSRELGDPNIGPVVPGEIHTAYATGDQTMDLAGPWMYKSFIQATKNSPLLKTGYHVYGMPSITAGKPGNVFWGWAWCVNAKSQHKDQAWQLVGYIEADPAGQAEGSSGIWQPVPGLAQKVKGQIPFAQQIEDAAQGGQAIFVTEHYAQIARILRGEIESMAFQGADIQSSLNDAVKKIDPILDGK